MSPAIILIHEDAQEAACRRIKATKVDSVNPYAVWIAPYKKIRSLEANAKYWSLVGLVAEATGHDREVLHVYFKRQAFGVRVEQIGEEMVEFVPSSAKATKGDFSELIEFVQRFIAENSIEASA